ncbi:Nn.00g070020.m01.CDS01 [Neocucurbitaria sp. VM-36]
MRFFKKRSKNLSPVPNKQPLLLDNDNEASSTGQGQPGLQPVARGSRQNHQPHCTPHTNDQGRVQQEPITTASNLQITENDVLIAVMGVTGCGKSTFINHLTDSDIKVGHGLESCTDNIGIYPCWFEDRRRFYLIDTPGFDDPYLLDSEVLKMIAYFLAATYSRNVKLADIVYMHAITDSKMRGSAMKNLAMFQALCGTSSLEHVVLASSKWDQLTHPNSHNVGERREKELAENPNFWGDMLQSGSAMFRYENTRTSALKVINHIMNARGLAVLDIQRQLIDQKQRLHETSAGQVVQRELNELRLRYENELELLHEGFTVASKNQKLLETMERMKTETATRLDKTVKQREALNVDYEQLQAEQEVRYQEYIRDLNEALEQQKAVANEKQAALNQLEMETAHLHTELAKVRQDRNTVVNKLLADREEEQRLLRIFNEKQQAKMEAERQVRSAQAKTGSLITTAQSIAGLALVGAGTMSGNMILSITGGVILGSLAFNAPLSNKPSS